MPRIPTPIPTALVTAIRGVFAGSWSRVLWKLLVLVVGTFLVVYIVSTTGSYLVMAVVGIIVTIALSSTVRKIAMDIWRGAFWTFKP